MPSDDEYKKQAAELDAERAFPEAQKKRDDAKKELEGSQNPKPPAPPKPPDSEAQALADQTALAAAAKGLADAQKAAADARKAEVEAAAAALKARIGEVPSSGYTRSVELKDKAGVAEASLPAAKAVVTAAEQIVKALRPPSEATQVFVLAASEVPTFQESLTLRAQAELVKRALDPRWPSETASPRAGSTSPTWRAGIACPGSSSSRRRDSRGGVPSRSWASAPMDRISSSSGPSATRARSR